MVYGLPQNTALTIGSIFSEFIAQSQKNWAILADEADVTLVNEALTPHIISKQGKDT